MIVRGQACRLSAVTLCHDDPKPTLLVARPSPKREMISSKRPQPRDGFVLSSRYGQLAGPHWVEKLECPLAVSFGLGAECPRRSCCRLVTWVFSLTFQDGDTTLAQSKWQRTMPCVASDYHSLSNSGVAGTARQGRYSTVL